MVEFGCVDIQTEVLMMGSPQYEVMDSPQDEVMDSPQELPQYEVMVI